jgi:hypothetical protein
VSRHILQLVDNYLILFTLIRTQGAVEIGEALAQIDIMRNVDMRPHWYVAYTLPRHEESVADRLINQDIETYLPLYSLMRTWNRRRAEVDLPLLLAMFL